MLNHNFYLTLVSFLVLPTIVIGQKIHPAQNVVPEGKLPPKEKLHVYIMAGQSNMAGRGIVEPQDTVINPRLITLNQEGQWVYAQEPLHHYEPSLQGLDCGKSFGDHLISALPEDVFVALIPAAVGGSSIDQWLQDQTYREVKLWSNLETLVSKANEHGTIKGVIWHQGESDANPRGAQVYEVKMKELIQKMRMLSGNPNLPFIMGELGGFWVKYKNPIQADQVNKILHQVAKEDKNAGIIITSDLHHKGDTLHFNGPSLRIMGERYATEMLKF